MEKEENMSNFKKITFFDFLCKYSKLFQYHYIGNNKFLEALMQYPFPGSRENKTNVNLVFPVSLQHCHIIALMSQYYFAFPAHSFLSQSFRQT